MAPAKKQAKGAPPPAAERTPVKKLTRKEKHEINSKAFREKSKARLGERIALRKELRPDSPGRNALVAQPVDGSKRPTVYTEELGGRICHLFSTDPKFSLLRMNEDPTLPTVWTFYTWLQQYPTLDKAYSRAREVNLDLKAQELEDWATTPRPGIIRTTRTGTGAKGEIIDTEEIREVDAIERARLMVETRKWILSKERPKKYGVQPIEVEGDGALQDLLAQFRARSKELEEE